MPRLAATATATNTGSWADLVVDPVARAREPVPLLGAIPGEGIGPEVVQGALAVLAAVEEAGGGKVVVETGGVIGREAERVGKDPLPTEMAAFIAGVLERGGAILNGPGGGRYVYDLRRQLGLAVKITPVEVRLGLPAASSVRPEVLDGVDLLVVRENLGGVYQGSWKSGDAEASQSFSYTEETVCSFLAAAARLARARRGELTVVIKEAGVPAISRLWCDCAAAAAEEQGIVWSAVDVDLMAYRLAHRPTDFDVIAAPNLFGDILSDLAAVLLGSRGLSFGASYTREGGGVYQTNHGAAHDLEARNTANPVGQILSLAMLLRESLGMEPEARAIEAGVIETWRAGWCTADLAAGGGRVVGTREMSELVGRAAAERLRAAPRAA